MYSLVVQKCHPFVERYQIFPSELVSSCGDSMCIPGELEQRPRQCSRVLIGNKRFRSKAWLCIRALEADRRFGEMGRAVRRRPTSARSSVVGTRPTGGTLSLVDAVGPAKFVAECRRLAKLYGERFKRTCLLSILGRAVRHV